MPHENFNLPSDRKTNGIIILARALLPSALFATGRLEQGTSSILLLLFILSSSLLTSFVFLRKRLNSIQEQLKAVLPIIN